MRVLVEKEDSTGPEALLWRLKGPGCHTGLGF